MARESNRRRGAERLVVTDLEVLRWAHGGDAVAVPSEGPLAGRVVFLEDAVPGDRVDAEIVERKERWARGRIVAVTRPSPERRKPPCPIQARCGGCPWMHGSAAAQARSRRLILEGEVRKVLGEAVVGAIVFADGGPELGHRQRLRLGYEVSAGRVVLGLRGRRTHTLIDVAECAIADARLNAALPAVRQILARRGKESGRVTLLAGSDGPDGVGAHIAPERGAAFSWGPELVSVTFGRYTQMLSPAAFAQANAAVTGEILDALTEWARTHVAGGHVVELFAGSGTLTMALWAAGCRVTAYEVDPRAREAFERTRQAVGGVATWHELDLTIGVPLGAGTTESPRGVPGHAAGGSAGGAGTTESPRGVPGHAAGGSASGAGGKIDAIVLDPPRTGAREVMPWVRASGARHIAYLSCDLATGLRDVAELTQAGYRVDRIIGYDMFPHTGHQELLILLRGFISGDERGMGSP